MTDCTSQIDFRFPNSPQVRVTFDEGHLTQDAGLLLLRQLDGRRGLTRAFASALRDWRAPGSSLHSLHDLVRERVFAIAQGYEDCNDVAQLRDDPLFKAACDRGATGAALASQPTLSRFEHGVARDLFAVRGVFVERFLARLSLAPKEIVLDVDTTDDPTHGQQELAFYNTYYGTHCYQPLIITTGEGDLLWAELLGGTESARVPAVDALLRIVIAIRQKFPNVVLKLRADNGFATPALYDFCEDSGIEYTVNAGTHAVFCKQTEWLVNAANVLFIVKGQSETAMAYSEFMHQAKSWRSSRRIIAKAARSTEGNDQRFLVTNGDATPEETYSFYAGRGLMESFIKDFKTGLTSGKTSCSSYAANELRLLLFAVAYQLMHELRGFAPAPLRTARFETLRLRVLRVAARVKRTARKLWVRACRSHPWRDEWLAIARNLLATA